MNSKQSAKPCKLVMTLLVRNEEDIIRHNIDFHLSRGVDFIIATDNASTDNTVAILKEYEQKGLLHLIIEPSHDHNQAIWNNRMAQMARERYGADIIFHCDADEFWHPRSGNLKDEISQRFEDILIVDLQNILLTDREGDESFPEDTRYAVVNPIVAADYQEETKRQNLFHFRYPQKVMFKTSKKLFLVRQGNHSVANKDGETKEGVSRDVIIYHYPIRSKAGFYDKTIRSGSAYESTNIHPKHDGFHLRRWYAAYKDNRLDEEYRKLLLPRENIADFVKAGFIEEMDFTESIAGKAKDPDKWTTHYRPFEYENFFEDLHLPWAGHKYFVYDLIRNIQPAMIVDLKTDGGVSFLTLCQAVKDGRYNAHLYSVDAGGGDAADGSGQRKVPENIRHALESCYPSLKADLIRGTSEEAVSSFENHSIDLLMVDGFCAFDEIKRCIDTWLPKMKPDGIILLHDIFMHRENVRIHQYWEELRKEHCTIEFQHSYGLGVLCRSEKIHRTFMSRERQWQMAYSSRVLNRQRDAMKNAMALFRGTLLADLKKAADERDHALAQVNKIENSTFWKMTGPLRSAAHHLRYNLPQDYLKQAESMMKSCYHRLPLSNSTRRRLSRYFRMLKGGMSSWRTQKTPFHVPVLKPSAQQEGIPDYVVWGVIDWHFRYQRPQQLARALAKKGRRVFYISPHFVDDKRPGFRAESLDESGCLFQIKLFVLKAPIIYESAPDAAAQGQLRAGIGEVLLWAGSGPAISLVEHPFWTFVAGGLPNCRLVYDCMDHHEGFNNYPRELVALEKDLIRQADLTVVSSSWLESSVGAYAKRTAVIRNACEYRHFSEKPPHIGLDQQGRRIIGYYGAIAEWMDIDLVAAIARQHPDCRVMMIGADTVRAAAQLSGYSNIEFTGEISYDELPSYLHGFDVCILPFKVLPLTLATNPVKIYEYLSAGKVVVAIDLPEMAQFTDLIYTATDRDQFMMKLRRVLETTEPDSLINRRKAFAERQTWTHRCEDLIRQAEVEMDDPTVSVIVVTHNNLEYTRKCLTSLERHSHYVPLEIIVVDNASSDGSPEYLQTWVNGNPFRRLILNQDNRGFAAANNQGLEIAAGDYLVLLNNDTYVTPGWIRNLVNHLRRDPSIGMIGPVTNNIGNEARIDIDYDDMDDMLTQSRVYTLRRIGQVVDMRTVAFFCVMMPRDVYAQVGALDEAFGLGFFEDDDYCRRVERIGRRIVCAEDVFIHHELSASFDKLKQTERQRIFDQSRKVYEAKWGTWIPHNYRA